MAKEKDHIINSEEYQRYLDDQMTPRERHDFENKMLEDEFENEALDGLSQLTSNEISADLKTLKNELASKKRKRNPFNYWRIAASLLLLGVFSFIVYFLIESNTTKEIAQTKEMPSEEESVITQHSGVISPDSSEKDSDRIVAYQLDLEETKKSSPEVNRQPSYQTTVIEEPSQDALLEIEDSEEELESIIMDMEVAEPVDLPTLARVQEEQIPIEIESTKRKKEIVSEKALAPSAERISGAAASQSRMAARDENLRTISGKVRSQEDDEVIPGVNIIVKGTGNGTVSDTDGNYSIVIPNDTEVILVYSSVGYTTGEIAAGNHETIDVNIEPDITALSEIVVAGYEQSSETKKSSYSFIPPKPVDGNEKFKDYVKANLRYPSSGLEDKVKGTVKLKFSIEQNGTISNMEVLKSLGTDFDKEAVRLVNEGPKWEPAKENNVSVVRDVKVKIRFRPPE